MKKFLLSVLLAAGCVALHAETPMVRQTRFEGRNITGVVAGSSFNVEVYQSDTTRMEENRFSLVVVIAHKGNTELVMDAARGADAGGGTIIHAKGIGEKSAMPFFGMSIASEQEVIYIVSKQENEKNIIRAIMEKAGSRQDRVAAVFSLPVNRVVGLRSLTDE